MKPIEETRVVRGSKELFGILTEKSKSRSRVDIYVGLVYLLLMIVGLIVLRQRLTGDAIDILSICFVIMGCFGSWLILYSCWFIRKVDKLDTPEQLLDCNEKKYDHYRMSFIFIFVVTLVMDFVRIFYYTEIGLIYEDVMGVVLLLFVLFYFVHYKFSFVDDILRDEDQEILDQLDDLVYKS